MGCLLLDYKNYKHVTRIKITLSKSKNKKIKIEFIFASLDKFPQLVSYTRYKLIHFNFVFVNITTIFLHENLNKIISLILKNEV